MCIVFFTATDHYSLIVASNRDEFLARPTTRAAWHAWDPSQLAQQPSDTARVLSGLDLSAGGTWLGISLPPTEHRTLRFATLTNYTETIPPAQRPSRGNLTRAFLDPPVDAPLPSQAQSVDPLQQYLDQVEATKADYAGFNLLVGQVAFPAPAASAASQPPSAVAGPVTRLGYISNRETPSKRARVLDDIGTAGHVRGLSNATLEVEEGEQEWPKVKSGAAAVERAARRAQEEVDRRGLSAEEAEERLVEGLYEALSTSHPAPIQHRAHLRHTVLVRPLYFDPSSPTPDLPPPFPPPSSSSSTPPALPTSTSPAELPASTTAGPRESPDASTGAHWYATRVQTLLLVERATGRVVLRERDAYVLDREGRPRWSGEERVFEVAL